MFWIVKIITVQKCLNHVSATVTGILVISLFKLLESTFSLTLMALMPQRVRFQIISWKPRQ